MLGCLLSNELVLQCRLPATRMLTVVFIMTLGITLTLGNVVDMSDSLPVRLVDGGNCSGRVEVYRSRQWGTVCGYGWDLRDANVVCRELGCGWATGTPRNGLFGRGRGVIWLTNIQCSGEEEELAQCRVRSIWSRLEDSHCSHHDDAAAECSGPLERPALSLLSDQSAFSPGEAVRFSCSAPPIPYYITDFYLYRQGPAGPLAYLRATPRQTRAELTVVNMEAPKEASYTCVYRIQGGHTLRSPPSNPINITVVELHTPEIWYNVSVVAPPSRVVRGHGFNVTCSTPHHYPGGSIQLRLVRSNGTERQSVPAFSPSVTFTFPSAQASHEGYYYCLHRVQLGGRVFTSRESQPLPIILIEPTPLLSAMEVSWLASAIIFVVAVLVIVAVACGLRKRKRTPTELERHSRTCVENTYMALPVK
ncbi:hypothetical protein SKAU_G00101470 [Synaphobranchus kaupii]|uniref:Deleted in malignant brain tumors 1 protein-like n=1 Tax=Synaphobranchus kaupii TaxID=118154 RepID=A0A9Q1FYB6_SYNKA|nr:hypothetical protein SKAU_G00101470 [Synaphobranchus kaupii]